MTWPPELTYRTVADGLRTNLSDLTFAHLRERLDGIVTVTEAEILSTAVALAALGRASWPSPAARCAGRLAAPSRRTAHEVRPRRGPVVAVVSGGNVDPALLADLVAARTQPAGLPPAVAEPPAGR